MELLEISRVALTGIGFATQFTYLQTCKNFRSLYFLLLIEKKHFIQSAVQLLCGVRHHSDITTHLLWVASILPAISYSKPNYTVGEIHGDNTAVWVLFAHVVSKEGSIGQSLPGSCCCLLTWSFLSGHDEIGKKRVPVGPVRASYWPHKPCYICCFFGEKNYTLPSW